MSEMIDRIAAKIEEAAARDVVCGDDYCDCHPLKNRLDCMGIKPRLYARLALEALREPTEKMENAVQEWELRANGAKFCWHAMIDAALREEPR